MILNKRRKWFHSSRVILALVSKLLSGVHKFDLDFVFQIDSVKQPIKSNSVGSGHVSHRRTSSFYDHLDHGFAVFKNVQLRLALRKNVCWWVHNPHQNIDQPFAFF